MIAVGISKELPGIRELVSNIEERPAVTYVTLRYLVSSASEHLASLACCIVEVQDHVAQGVHIEEVVLRWEFDAPATDRT
jgi:hypothetical protein